MGKHPGGRPNEDVYAMHEGGQESKSNEIINRCITCKPADEYRPPVLYLYVDGHIGFQQLGEDVILLASESPTHST